MCGNKNKSLSTKSGLYGGWAINSKFCTVEKALIWADVWELTLAWWTIIRLLLFVFQISPKKLWCTTQDWPSYVAEVEQSPHDQFYRRNKRPFSSKRFFHKQLSLEWLDFENLHGGLLFCFGIKRIDLWFVTWRSYKRLLKHRHRIFPTTRTFSLTIVKLCGIQWEQIFFTARCSCNIECMLVEEIPKDNNLTICHVTIWHYQFTASMLTFAVF